MHEPETAVLEGMLSVMAALRSGNRDVHAVLVDEARTGAGVDALARAAAVRGVQLQSVTREEIDRHASGTRHGGVLALVGPRRFLPLADLLPAGRSPFIAMVDGVEDPYNFGAAIRSLYAAGADGLVLRPRNWMSAAGIVARASAGTSELIPTAIAESAVAAADYFEQEGLTVACAADRDAISLYRADLRVPLFLLIGGEQRGITRSFLRRAALRLRIPYGRPGEFSLGTAAATAVIAFEVARQRASR